MSTALLLLMWLPATGSGLMADYLLRTDAPEVVVLIADQLNGERGCYFTVGTATARVWQYNQVVGDWIGDGHFCRVTARRTESGAVRLAVQFRNKFKGEKTVYVLARPEGRWYRAGTWDVRDVDVPQLPPYDPLESLSWLNRLFPSQ